MAAAVTTINDPGVLAQWDRPLNPLAPISSVFFADPDSAVAAKDAADEMTITLTLTLPPNFFYRLAFLELGLEAPAIADLEDYEKAARVEVFEAGISTGRFALYNLTEFATGGAEPGFKAEPDAVTNDFSTFFAAPPGKLQTELIDARNGVTIVQVRLVDTSADATSALVFSYRCRAWQYTVEQALMSEVNTPTLIV